MAIVLDTLILSVIVAACCPAPQQLLRCFTGKHHPLRRWSIEVKFSARLSWRLICAALCPLRLQATAESSHKTFLTALKFHFSNAIASLTERGLQKRSQNSDLHRCLIRRCHRNSILDYSRLTHLPNTKHFNLFGKSASANKERGGQKKKKYTVKHYAATFFYGPASGHLINSALKVISFKRGSPFRFSVTQCRQAK